ncbi:MAG: mechanosensitive ion channel [Bacteroidales bacterium]|nr:mechanosensitive ion channel [Bacteroidales bacterium]
METFISEILDKFLISIGVGEAGAPTLRAVIIMLSLLGLSFIAFYFTRKILLGTVHRLTRKTKTQWDDILYQRRFFKKLSLFIPSLFVMIGAEMIKVDFPQTVDLINHLVAAYNTLILLFVLDAFISALYDIYSAYEVSNARPIKPYIQVLKIAIFFVGGIIIVANLIGQDPTKILTGLGAITAILLLIFKDTILGLVGGVQLSANDMVRPGDWIEMPKYGADGTVIDISLTTVKVQNWNKTISTIPTYSMVTESFMNWRGMEESGGRRIKRSINIDMNSVKFCTDEMIQRYEKIHVLSDYIKSKEKELISYNARYDINEDILVNGRRQTNIGVFRAYLEKYLKNLPDINQNMTFLIRQLQPNEQGIPIEIYVFSKVQAWAEYEGIQSDIFDHILAVLPQFELRVFQSPTGADFGKLMK